MMKINLRTEVPSHLAFSLMLILSFLVAWFSVNTAQEIVEKSKESPAFNVKSRMQKQIPTDEIK